MAADLDTSGPCWVFKPAEHKTEHHGKEREIHLGPKAQALIEPFLKPDTQAYLFAPSEAEAQRHQQQAQSRKTRVQPFHAKRHERAMIRAAKGKRQRPPMDRYTVDSYRRAITRACELAFPVPDGADAATCCKEHHWHPHQLRHNAATFLRRQYGIEVARVVLGHHSSVITEVYAEMDRTQAAKIMAQVG